MKSLIILAALGGLHAQTLEFELASIKPSDPAATIAIRRSGHRIVTTSTSLLFLIGWAYDIHTDRIYGKPNWLDNVRYDVIASAPQDDSAHPELQKRMQALLADRFQLAVHRETKELSVYTLIEAKGGAKLKLAPAPESMGQNPFSMPGRGRLVGTQVSAEMLAKVLSNQLGHSVQDQTGLKGVFDFKLEWEPDTSAPAEARTGSSLFTALQEQLGLKVESRKVPVEVLVIDKIESKPKEN
jgi:uncharacterized protein (TIGR03435 family)